MPIDSLLGNLDSFTKIAVNIAAVFAGLWAIYTYKKSKRAEATKRIFDLYTSFYSNEEYFWARDTFEHDYHGVVSPLVEKRVTDRHVKLRTDEIEHLRQLDLMFNFFEHLIYLEEQGILQRSDREVFFEYWFDFLAYPERGGLRRYFENCGYERLAIHTKTHKEEYVALDAAQVALLKTQDNQFDSEPFRANDALVKFVELECTIADTYQIFKVDSVESIRRIDSLLGYCATERSNGRVIRTNFRMTNCNLDCWVYLNDH